MAKIIDGEKASPLAQMDPKSESSLIPMLIGGLVLITVGMIGVMAFG